MLCEIKEGQGVRGFRPSGRRSNDHWSPLDKPIIRKIREIRDLIQLFIGLRYGRVRDNSPEGARRLQTGVLAPGDGFPHTRKPCKGDKSLSCLQHSIVGAWYNGGCSLRSRPREVHPRLWSDQPLGLDLVKQNLTQFLAYFLPLK